MKKISILALCVLGLSLCANSANFGGKKFYINPGHGGHDSDDRPTALPLSVPMFYESDGNLDRGNHLYSFFVNNGGQAKMSRTTNNSSDDLALSTIASYANSYGGYFISLHSNGANASANYICAMFRSQGSSTSNSNEAIAGSKAMATAAVNWQDAVTLSNQTYETPRTFADYPFYGYHLGVLRTNNCPGYLIESWFHDYRPEALRMKSTVYNKVLAWQIARASLQSPGGSGTLQAVVQGDIRDLSKSCGYTNYTTRGRDQYKAVNGATVQLLNSSGAVVSSMTTDNCENGFYAFFIDSTGTYTIKVSKSGYKTATKTVNVSALSTQQMCTFDLAEGADEGIAVSPAAVDFGKVTIGAPATASVTVTGNGLSSAISASINNSEFTLSTSSLAASGGKLTITCSPSSAGAKSATLTLKSGSFTKTVLVNATAVNPPLKLTEIWNYSETSGKNASWTSDKAAIRNMCYGNGKLFVVKPSAAEILVVDARTAQQVGTVNTTGIDGGTFKVMDVQFVNGKLLATNLATATSPILKVYVWNDGYDAAPSVLLNTTDFAGFTRIGDTFSVKGDLTSGELLYAAGSTSEENKIVKYAISNGVASTTPTTIAITEGTQGIKLGSSPRVVADSKSNKYWINGQNYYASLVSAEGMLESTLNSAQLKNVYQGNSFTTFDFRGSSYGAALTYLPKEQSATGETITAGRAILFDGTNGWASAENIGEYPAAGLGTTRNTSFSSNISVNVTGDDCVEMWVLVNNQGVAYYRYGAIPGPTVSVSASSLNFNTEAYTPVTKTVTISGSNLEGDINLALSGANADLFSLSTSTIEKAAGSATVTITYSPESAGTHTATLTASSANATGATVSLSGSATAKMEFDDNVTMLTEGWVYSATKGNTADASWLSLADPASSDIAYNAGKLYVLNGKPYLTGTIAVVDAKTGAKIKDLDMTGVTGGWNYSAGLAVLGGKLLLSNAARDTDNFIVYIWDDDNSKPRVFLNVDGAGHGSIDVGDRLNVAGDMTNGKILVSNSTKMLIYPVTNGTASTAYQTVVFGKTLGSHRAMVDITANADGTYWVTAKDTPPTHVAADGTILETVETSYANVYATGAEFIDFGTRKYMAAMTYLNKAGGTTTLADGALTFTDITDGININAPQIYPQDSNGTALGLGSTRNTRHYCPIVYAVEDNTLNIWALSGYQGIGYWYYNGEKKSAVEAISAGAMRIGYNGREVSVIGADAARISVYSTSGAMVADVRGENTLNVSLLARGVYIVRALDRNGNVATSKILR